MADINKQSRTFKFTKTKLQQILYPDNNEEILYHDTESSCLKLKVTKKQKTFYFIGKIKKKVSTFLEGGFAFYPLEGGRVCLLRRQTGHPVIFSSKF